MSQKQTIDGVPRAAIEILLSGKGGLAQAAAAYELRALLDAAKPQGEPVVIDETPQLAGELWDARVGCDHDIQPASGGGVKCTKCTGWFCY